MNRLCVSDHSGVLALMERYEEGFDAHEAEEIGSFLRGPALCPPPAWTLNNADEHSARYPLGRVPVLDHGTATNPNRRST